jgi:hypothetical protein
MIRSLEKDDGPALPFRVDDQRRRDQAFRFQEPNCANVQDKRLCAAAML